MINEPHVLDPSFWVGRRLYPKSKWHLLYANGGTVCGFDDDIDEDGPLDSLKDGELCGQCERIAIARRIPVVDVD